MPRILRRLVLSFAALVLLGTLAVLAARVPRVLRAARICPPPSEAPASPAGPLPFSATTGLLLVANQKSASASIVDLATGAITHLPTGEEPHEAAVSPDGRWGFVSDYGRARSLRRAGRGRRAGVGTGAAARSFSISRGCNKNNKWAPTCISKLPILSLTGNMKERT